MIPTSLFESFFLYENKTANRIDSVFYNQIQALPGQTNILLNWRTDKRTGALTGFKIGFLYFVPPISSYNFVITKNQSIIPMSGPGISYNQNVTLSEKVDYYSPFDDSGSTVFSVSIFVDPIFGTTIYPYATFYGFYTK